jgi:prepilin peptidase CpaA
MHQPAFPNTAFGWTFFACLALLTGFAAVYDLRRAIVPKWLALVCLGLGFLVNIVRGIWMSTQEEQFWVLAAGNGWLGALDGFLFSLSGAGLAFGLLLVLWMLGTCGGGDVKLFTAVGAWLGPRLAIYSFGMSLVVLVVCIIAWVAYRGLSARRVRATLKGPREELIADMKEGRKPGKLRVTYSLSIALATLIILLWAYRIDLQLVASPA